MIAQSGETLFNTMMMTVFDQLNRSERGLVRVPQKKKKRNLFFSSKRHVRTHLPPCVYSAASTQKTSNYREDYRSVRLIGALNIHVTSPPTEFFFLEICVFPRLFKMQFVVPEGISAQNPVSHTAPPSFVLLG